MTCSTNPAVFNTGIDGTNGYNDTSGKLIPGTLDAHWQLAAVSGVVYPTVLTAAYPNPATNASLSWADAPVYYLGSPWAVSPFGNAQWIGSGSFGNGTVFYRYRFNLDGSVDPTAFNLNLNGYVDDAVTQIYINGQPLYTAATSIGGFTSTGFASLLLNRYWQDGPNDIIIQTYNIGAPTGLLMQSTGTVPCAGALNVSKKLTSSATTVTAGNTVSFKVTVTNNSTSGLTGVTLSDPLATGFASGSWSCTSPSPSTAACPAPSGSLPLTQTLNLPASSQLVFTVNETVGNSPPPVITNTATVTPVANADTLCKNGDGSNSCSASASVSTGAYLQIDKTAASAGPFYPGETVSYDVSVKNVSSVAIAGVQATDTLPPGLTGATWSCSAPVGSTAACPAVSSGSFTSGSTLGTAVSMPAQSSLVYAVTAMVDARSTVADVINTATVSATTAGTQCWNGSAVAACSASANVTLWPLAQIALSKTVNATSTVYVGDAVTYAVSVNNTGAVTTSGNLSDVLPTGLSNVTWSCLAEGAGAICPADNGTGDVSATVVSLPAGGKLTYTISATLADAQTTPLTNTAQWTPDSTAHTQCYAAGSNTPSSPCTAEVAIDVSALLAPVLSLTNTVSPAAVLPGASVVYKVVATNTNVEHSQAIADGSLTMTVPGGVTLGDWVCTATGDATCPSSTGTGALNLSGLSLPPGGSLAYTINAAVASTASGTLDLPASLGSQVAGASCVSGSSIPCAQTATLKVTPAATSVAPVPTLGPWSLAFLTLGLGMMGLTRCKRLRVQR